MPEYAIPDKILNHTVEWLSHRFGLRTDTARIIKSIRSAAAFRMEELNFDDPYLYFNEMILNPLKSESEAQHLFNCISVNETYFFRSPEHFEALSKNIMPEIAATKCDSSVPSLSIWCAGCSTGEEPYTLAIMRHTGELGTNSLRLDILGTDQDFDVIKKARLAAYKKRSMNYVPDYISNTCFKSENSGFSLLPEISSLVRFEEHNLNSFSAADPYSSKWDVIFCRNVLIYLDKPSVTNIMKRFHDCLNDPGWLILGPAESQRCPETLFDPVEVNRTFIFKKKRTDSADYRYPTNFTSLYDDKSCNKKLSPSEGNIPFRTETLEEIRETVMLLRNESHTTEALNIVNDLISSGHDKAELNFLRGLLLTDEGRLEEATAALNEAIFHEYSYVPAYLLLGILFREDKTSDKGIQNLKKVIYLDRDNVLAHFLLGGIYLSSNDREAGIKEITLTKDLLLKGARVGDEFPGGFTTAFLESACDNLLKTTASL